MGSAILHAFNWTFRQISEKLPQIKAIGYSAVLTSPISYSKGDDWWMRYQPLDFRIIYSPLGTKTDFEQLLKKTAQLGVNIFVDVVINHMAHRHTDDLNYPGETELAEYATNQQLRASCLYGDISKNQFSADDFNPKALITNYNNLDEVRHCRIQDARVPNGLPDFEFNEWVVSQQRQFMEALLDMGVSGFRIDAAKHVPSEHLQAILPPELLRRAFVFAEVIPNLNFVVIKEVLEKTPIALYDFPLFRVIRETFEPDGSFRKLIAYEQAALISRFRAVTMVNTHDIPNNEGMQAEIFHSIDDELLAHAYILGRDGGSPLIFTDLGDNRNGVQSFNNRWKNWYAHPEIRAMIMFHNQCHSSKMNFIWVDDGLVVAEREAKGFFAINKTQENFFLPLDFKHNTGIYYNVLDHTEITINSDKRITLKIPARSVLMMLPL